MKDERRQTLLDKTRVHAEVEDLKKCIFNTIHYGGGNTSILYYSV